METAAKPKRAWLSAKAKRRIKRALLGILIAIPVVIGATWYAANHVPWFGAWLADTLRSVLGTERVADLEEFAYDLEDRWNRAWRTGEKPKAYWDAPSASSSGAPPANSPSGEPTTGPSPSGSSSAAPSPSGTPNAGNKQYVFPPMDVGPYDAKFAAPGDGTWVRVELPGVSPPPPPAPGKPPPSAPVVYKTLLHPDAKRPWAEVFVVAIDLGTADLHMVAGTREPKGTAPGSSEAKRTGLVPEADVPGLLCAMNGGFKEEHGHYGMKVGGVLLIRPRVDGCTIARTKAGGVRIGAWKSVVDEEPTFEQWRQTPACLIDNGKLHPGLFDENTNWGAALGGGTIVRRSAMGIDASGGVLFAAVSNHTSPRAIALAMLHAGSVAAAQLDINYSYPRFVIFPAGDGSASPGQRETTSLFEGFKVEKDDYLRTPSVRDFFYFTRR